MLDQLPDIEGKLGLLHEATPVVIVDTAGNPVTISGGGGTTGGLTDTQLRAAPVPVLGPLTDAQIRASALNVETVTRSTAVDKGSGSIGTVASTLMAANATRRGIVVRNLSTTATIYINSIATATADYHSYPLYPGEAYESSSFHVGAGAISIISTAANTSVYAREF